MRKPIQVKFPVLTLALLLFSAISFAQGIGVVNGRVTSRGEELAGATVQVDGRRGMTTTSGNGTFILSLPAGTYNLQVTYAGMQPVTRSVTVYGETPTY